MTKHLLSFLSIIILILISVSPLRAQAPCTIVYGGGVQENDQPFCMETVNAASPTPKPQTNARDIEPTPQRGSAGSAQSKGGLAVAPAPTTNTQPATGPESAALLAILPAGALGWFLRKSARS